MKKITILIIVTVLFIMSGFYGCVKYPDVKVDNSIFVNKSSLAMYVGDEIQLTASPSGNTFQWSSDDETVAKVSNGLVEAVSEGNATIIVKSGDVSENVRVTVSLRIPLTDIIITPNRLIMLQNQTQILTPKPVPFNASEVKYTWHSDNPSIATVNSYGKVEAVATTGSTDIWCQADDVRQSVEVTITIKLDKTNWTVLSCSDEKISDGGGKGTLIDNNFDSYWHSEWGPDAPLPHWAIIDMGGEKEIFTFSTYRRKGSSDSKTVSYYIGDSPEADSPSWIKIAEGVFSTGDLLTMPTTVSAKGRYLKIYLPDSNRAPFTSIAEIEAIGAE